jgi:hypothetical protein
MILISVRSGARAFLGQAEGIESSPDLAIPTNRSCLLAACSPSSGKMGTDSTLLLPSLI